MRYQHKSRDIIGKTHGEICEDLGVYVIYLQITAKEVDKSNKPTSIAGHTKPTK